MPQEFLAHIAEDGRLQSVEEHLVGTARLAEAFASAFEAAEHGYLSGISHDVGKYSKEFQKRLRGGARVDHSTAGAFECAKINAIPAALAVAGHHGGIPDLGSQEDNIDRSSFGGRMNRAVKGNLPDYSAWQNEVTLPPVKPPEFCRNTLDIMFFTRMLFSCLTDADFIDTQRFMDGSTGQTQDAVQYATISDLLDRLDKYTGGWFPPSNELNRQRCEILKQCSSKGNDLPTGLFSLTVPTGGGKTISSLSFALHHAVSRHKARVIYVIPYTSIIEQTAAKFREILGEENVLEHHSGVVSDEEDEATPLSVAQQRACENWDTPVIVTTAVQFFESLFSNRSSACRKLHNIANSVVIFDEVQMLPIPYLQPCVYAISQLVLHYKVSAVLCTATQPYLERLFERFAPGLCITELCEQEQRENSVFERVRFKREGTLTTQEIAAAMNQKGQILCIVNTRKGAHEVFSGLCGEGCYHLSTLMYPAHRRRILAEIRQRVDKKNRADQPCKVVSTSLIEAGVDVDFPEVWRERAGLDSILQAAGRCNREGRNPIDESIVTVFTSDIPVPRLFHTNCDAADLALDRYSPDHPKVVEYYFRELLDLKGTKAQDQKEILRLLGEGSFREAAQAFHLIDNETKAVYIPLEYGQELVSRLENGERSRSLFRQLNQYSVNIYPQHYSKLYDAGDIVLIDNQYPILWNTKLYSPQTGLSIEADEGKAEFV